MKEYLTLLNRALEFKC